MIKYQALLAYEQQKSTTNNSGDWEPQIKTPAGSVSERARFLGHRQCLLAVPSQGRGHEGVSPGAPCTRAQIPYRNPALLT
jgi:hypothetical protein